VRLIGVVVVFCVAWFLLRRANELCVVRVRDGKLRVLRGKAPHALLSDFDDILGRGHVRKGTLRIVSEAGVPRLMTPLGLRDDVLQQLRNALGRFQVLHFRTARPSR
jgi:hypothetical protein